MPTHHTSNSVRLNDSAIVEVTSTLYVEDHQIEITFSDGHIQIVDFGPFLTASLNPLIRKYLDQVLFQQFVVEGGDLQWNDYDLCFPIADLYENNLNSSRF